MKKLNYTAIIVLLIAFLAVSGCGKEVHTTAESQITVVTAKAGVMDIAKNVNYSGLVRGKNEVNVLSQVQARVTGILVQPGQAVKAGQTLITLDDSNYQAAVAQAQASLQQAQAGKAANDINVETARKNLERIQKLHETGAVSTLELEKAQDTLNLLTTGSSEAAVEIARAALQQAQDNLGKCYIKSPINGVVGNIAVSLGDYAFMNSPVISITDSSELEIEIMVGESEISYIKKGIEVDVKIKAVAEEPFKGVVSAIATVADQAKRSYAVKINLGNKENKIKSGMFAEVSLDTMSKKGVLCVPINAVIPRGEKKIVYVCDTENRAREIEVETGLSSSTHIEIVKGLTEGQEVIVKGNTLLNEGSLVRVVSGEV